MNTAEYKTMYELESFYWWHVARRKLLADLITELGRPVEKTTLLDVGCGTGLNHSVLSRFGEAYGVDMSPEALAFSHARGVTNIVLSTVENMDFPDERFDVVTALDMLEHTDHDAPALKELWRVTKPGGSVIITVPAYGFLWSEHDEALHHRRRYTAHELRNKLTNAGFVVQRSSYFITMMFFPIFFLRIMQNLTKKSLEAKTSHVMLPKWLNWSLIKMLDIERLYIRWSNLPFGVTVLAVATKPAQAAKSTPEQQLSTAAVAGR